MLDTGGGCHGPNEALQLNDTSEEQKSMIKSIVTPVVFEIFNFKDASFAYCS
jgi:hypothetical protein